MVVVMSVLMSFLAHGQGTILFNNRVAGQVDAPIMRTDGAGAGAELTAQLFHVTAAGASLAYSPLFPATTFQTTSAQAAFYLVQPVEPVVVPGVPAGSLATVVLRVWGWPNYEPAHVYGQSNPITITLGGIPPGGGAQIPDAVLVGLQSFALAPEPSTIGLGLLGTVGLMAWRRRR